MRVVYEWTQAEWDEAVRLATAPPRRRGSVSALTYGVILVPLIGAALTGMINLRHNERLTVAGTILPLLLVLFALCIALWIATMKWRMRRRALALPMPNGACEAILQEGGWRFCTRSGKSQEEASQTAAYDTEVLEAVEAGGATEGQESVEESVPETEDAVVGETTLKPWSSMTGARLGTCVMVFLHAGGFAGMPMRCLSEDQVGHMQRMMARKLRPTTTRR